MALHDYGKSALGHVLLASLAVLGATPVRAQSAQDLGNRAQNSYNQALEEAKAGHYENACRGFRNAETLYHNAIMALMQWPMRTDEERDYVKRVGASLQGDADDAKRLAGQVCGRPDAPQSVSSAASAAPVEEDLDDQKQALKQAESEAKGQYHEADRLYDAGDFAAACATARRSAAGFARITAAMKARPALEAAFSNPEQLYTNASQVAIDRDKYFCAKGG